MTALVNWERESPQNVEDFVAAFLLLNAGTGNQPRPSRGDGGIDVQISTPDGWDIYQVKSFTENLKAPQLRQIKKSWTRFRETVPTDQVRSWNLVMPLEPTPENLVWFNKLTADAEHTTEWMGLAMMDGWAGDNPRLRDYFFGDGAAHWKELIASAISAGATTKNSEGSELLSAVQNRTADLSEALNAVDPFYRYEVEVRSGDMSTMTPEIAFSMFSRPDLEESILAPIDSARYMVTHIIARSPQSTLLRPISSMLESAVSTDEEKEALARFFLFGAPLSGVDVKVTASSGPPGSELPVGEVASAWTFATPASELPDLELRLMRDGEPTMTVPVTDAHSSTAVLGPGRWLRVSAGPAVTMEFRYGSPVRRDSISVHTTRAPGAAVLELAPGLSLVAALPGSRLEVGVRGGQKIVGGFRFEENKISSNASDAMKLVDALVTVQSFTHARVVVPETSGLPGFELNALFRSVDLLRGGTLTGVFREIDVTANADHFAQWGDAAEELVTVEPMSIQLGGLIWNLTTMSRAVYPSVRVVRVGDRLKLRPGDSDQFTMHAVHGTLS